jgi:tRNA A-37 threonylcarbamoyl transferase component Bud32
VPSKNSHRVPWWIVLLAAVFVSDFALQTYCRVFGQPDFGISWKVEGNRRLVDAVAPGSPADRAGLKPGDVILGLGVQGIRGSLDPRVFLANHRFDRPSRFDVERSGRRFQLEIAAARVGVFADQDQFTYFGWQLASLVLMATALLVGFNRPFDYAARRGALTLAMLSVGIFFTSLPPGYAVIWRGLPRVLGALLWIPHLSVYFFGPILLTFFVLFPRPLFRARWPWTLIWLPALVLLPMNFRITYLTVYHPARAAAYAIPAWADSAQALSMGLYGLAAFAALAANYRRLKDVNERRRLRVLFIGGAAGVLPSLVRLVLASVLPVSAFTTFIFYGIPDLLIALIFILFPVCFAYSILRHRLLDIRVIVRRGLRYSLARGTLLSFLPAIAALLALDLTLHSRRPLVDILAARGWMYAGLVALALLAYGRRKAWLEKLDRRFFREQYNSQRILAGVLEDIREARSFERVAPRVTARIEAALHPRFVSVMVRRPEEREYRSLSSVPSGQTTPPLAADAKLVALARVLGKPLEVLMADTSWLEGRLPREEIDFAREAQIDLLVPIGGSPSSAEAVLTLGIKRSEEPYSREDQEVLEAIASSLALLFEPTARAPEDPGEGFEVCPRCGLCFDTGTGTCAQDGTALTRARLPRTLVGRYRLERRLGRGGMGAVYEAADSGLERRVAVKVIRDDLVGSLEAAQRFRQEARAAAGFAHPNVVTVHDYGVAAERHAFLVMELLEGSTLREELRRRSRLDPRRAVEVFRGVCAGVEAAHRRQIIHRDLKPENIFLARSEGFGEPGERVKVLDFGIAKLVATSEESADTETRTLVDTSPGIVVGTIAYLSPEQLLGGSPGVSWDLWALSVTAYETLTGALPFAGAPGDAFRQAVLAGRFAPLSERLEAPPAAWQAFFADGLASDPARRPQSAAELFHRLEAALGSA